MKDPLTTFKIWAPDQSAWAAWAKPVLFARAPASHHTDSSNFQEAPDVSPGEQPTPTPAVAWAPPVKYRHDTMIIVDLPGSLGVAEGLALAGLGYRPVPLYNGVYDPGYTAMIVQVADIVAALYQGADSLAALSLPADAPPAFLLDANRMKGSGTAQGKYDNRWCIFPQDMPSASYLAKQGIRRVILRTEGVQNDLSHVLCRYQEQGINIYLCDGSQAPLEQKATIIRPSRFKSGLYRCRVIMGLTRNATGGFGGKIPEAVRSHHPRTRHYGRIG